MKWNKITEELPTSHQLVWVKRVPNRIESEPIYLAIRRGSQPISENPDASSECYWYGMHYNGIFENPIKSFNDPILTSNFSDVTVEEWAYFGTSMEDAISDSRGLVGSNFDTRVKYQSEITSLSNRGKHLKNMTKEEALRKIRSIKLCLMAHPDNEPDSEFADRISDCEELEQCATQQAGTVKMMADALEQFVTPTYKGCTKEQLNEIRINAESVLKTYQSNTGSDVKEARDGWISVIDRLPEIDKSYLVSNGNVVAAAHYWNFCGKDSFWVDNSEFSATYWKELPNLPSKP